MVCGVVSMAGYLIADELSRAAGLLTVLGFLVAGVPSSLQ